MGFIEYKLVNRVIPLIIARYLKHKYCIGEQTLQFNFSIHQRKNNCFEIRRVW